eukprot:6191094-Pleurochrysis_carterae.AAC.1
MRWIARRQVRDRVSAAASAGALTVSLKATSSKSLTSDTTLGIVFHVWRYHEARSSARRANEQNMMWMVSTACDVHTHMTRCASSAQARRAVTGSSR